ncbi:PREDICTED: uncharacterized protein LOC108508514 isoform X3 [Lepidothrix coronata]|uniref:Uncharacterized protein LOC108508514 isoform X3 n=1 Tax=Lepidothrix coronata TaxID=321398 RepID=A0A6J0J1D6_9PASS|nr:PREDICTED: uncharacterized protein LOC108508514 isoform X3 [Lepidothrix coronata]
MVQARWALALILLLVALPAGGVGAAPWRPWAVALEREPVEKEAPQEDHQAVPVPGENTGAVQPTGVSGADKRRLSRTTWNAAVGTANTEAVNAVTAWLVYIKDFILAVSIGLTIFIFVHKVLPAWVQGAQDRAPRSFESRL